LDSGELGFYSLQIRRDQFLERLPGVPLKVSDSRFS